MPDVFVARGGWAPRSGASTTRSTSAPQREHGLDRRRLRLLGLLARRATRPAATASTASTRSASTPTATSPTRRRPTSTSASATAAQATNPTPTYGDGVVTPHASFLAMMHEPGEAFDQPARDPGRARGLRPGRVLRRRRRPLRHDRPPLPLARPGHGHGRDGQRARTTGSLSRRSAPATSSGAPPGHRHRGVRRRHRRR